MHVIVWEFRATTGREEEFERVYGPDGAWADLFARGDGYLGTELLRDVGERGRYITIDRWTSPAAFATFRDRWASDYRALDRRCEALTSRETPLGNFASG
jgi:heme-degrading monooxygenase HmoA